MEGFLRAYPQVWGLQLWAMEFMKGLGLRV